MALLHRLPALRQSLVSPARTSILPSSTHGTRTTIPNRRPQARTMASAPRTFEFLVVAHDAPGMLEKRLEVRPTHFAGLASVVDSGVMKMGGAILKDMPKDDEPSSLDFAGSAMVVVAESKEAVLEILKNDIYGKSGVWDLKNVQIYPFKCAVRKP